MSSEQDRRLQEIWETDAVLTCVDGPYCNDVSTLAAPLDSPDSCFYFYNDCILAHPDWGPCADEWGEAQWMDSYPECPPE